MSVKQFARIFETENKQQFLLYLDLSDQENYFILNICTLVDVGFLNIKSKFEKRFFNKKLKELFSIESQPDPQTLQNIFGDLPIFSCEYSDENELFFARILEIESVGQVLVTQHYEPDVESEVLSVFWWQTKYHTIKLTYILNEEFSSDPEKTILNCIQPEHIERIMNVRDIKTELMNEIFNSNVKAI